jgi:hypothetical protein
MRAYRLALALVAVGFQNSRAAEPNETFATRTVLASGVLTVSDALTPGFLEEPNTLLGVRDHFGEVYFTDDNGSPVGNGFASGLGGVSTNSGAIDFSITGYPDEFFEGGHGESGQYEVFVRVFDLFNEPVDSFSEVRTLAPGSVDDFSFNDFEWINGSYTVYINNAIGPPSGGDVDFFTFTGLSPGVTFSAETFDPSVAQIDTQLAWFDSAGTLIAENDDNEDDEGSFLSKLAGTVPAGGTLTFAVSGYGDDDYIGEHSEDAAYELKLTLGGAGFAADFNNDNMVTGADLATWRLNFGPNDAAGDADGDNDTDGADLLIWQRELGSGVGGPALAATSAIPEPSGGLLAIGAAALSLLARARWPQYRGV